MTVNSLFVLRIAFTKPTNQMENAKNGAVSERATMF